MTSKKHYICIIICILSCSSVYAQEMHGQINAQQQPVSLFQEALKVDLSKFPDAGLFSPPASNGWYPVKGEYYSSSSETEIAGYIYFKIGQNGLLDKKIFVSNYSADSTVNVMNCTPYTKGKDLIDTIYTYKKQTDGSYQFSTRFIGSYHYFDHFEADSFYYETIYQTWNKLKHQWDNFWRQRVGYHDTLVEFLNRFEEYYGQGDTWQTIRYSYDSITHNHQGFVDTLYKIRDMGNGDRSPKSKVGFINDEQGRYTQKDYFIKNGNNWDKSEVYSNITWAEWHGFTYCSVMVIGEEWVSPYKRSKVNSFYVDFGPFSDQFYQKWWDINGTQSNSDTLWRIIEDELYYNVTFDNIYNEYGDYVEWRNTAYSSPDANGKQEVNFISSTYHKLTYDELYGMTERMSYLIQFDKDEGLDTTIFTGGFKYTEFAPVSIVEHPQTKQTLSIFPNPVSGIVTISAIEDIEQLYIFDVTGRLVKSQSPASRQVIFDTGVLPKGVYLVQVRLKDGKVQTGKLIVR